MSPSNAIPYIYLPTTYLCLCHSCICFISTLDLTMSHTHNILFDLHFYFHTFSLSSTHILSLPSIFQYFCILICRLIYLSFYLSVFLSIRVFIHFPIYLHSYLSVLLSNFSSNTCLHMDRQCMVLFNRSLSLSLSLSQSFIFCLFIVSSAFFFPWKKLFSSAQKIKFLHQIEFRNWNTSKEYLIKNVFGKDKVWFSFRRCRFPYPRVVKIILLWRTFLTTDRISNYNCLTNSTYL